MKQEIKFSASCLIVLVLFFSCKKEALPLKAKTVKAKVIEYGSNLPVAGATLSICTAAFYHQNRYYECAGNYLTFTTDSNGECFFKTDGVYRIADRSGVLKNGYFNLDEPKPGCLFEDDGASTFGQTGTADSFTIRKVPITY